MGADGGALEHVVVAALDASSHSGPGRRPKRPTPPKHRTPADRTHMEAAVDTWIDGLHRRRGR
jgi:hypothetical protein